MRALYLVTITLLTTAISTTSAQAECYGDAVQAFGCQNTTAPTSRSGDLVRFGEEPAPVIPDYYGRGTGYSSDDLVSADERRFMMRDIILHGGRIAQSNGAQSQAVNSSARPIRSFGSRALRGYLR